MWGSRYWGSRFWGRHYWGPLRAAIARSVHLWKLASKRLKMRRKDDDASLTFHRDAEQRLDFKKDL
jgi:hypothetical protein